VSTIEDETPPTAAGMAQAVLDAETARRAEQAAADDAVVLPDDLLPGVGEDELTLKQGLAVGGAFTFWLLLILNSLDELESAALGILAPDIRDTLGVSNGVIVVISVASGAFLVLGSPLMGALADRYKRGPIVGVATLVFSAMVFLSGLVVNAFMLFWTRFGAGIAKSNTLTVHGSLLADTYPIQVRGRIGATTGSAGRLVAVLSPVVVGGIAAIAGGDEGWRWAFLLLGIPVAVFAIAAFRLPEPPRGQFEKSSVLGEVFEEAEPAPISMEAGFARLLRIRTLKAALVAFSAIGFGLFTVPVLANLFLEEEYDLGTFGRGVVGTVGGIASVAVLPFVGRYYDRLYRQDPAKALRLVGLLVLPSAALVPVQYLMPNAVLWTVCSIPQVVLQSVAFTMIGPLLQSIAPYRLRGVSAALGSVYIFFIGATGGALLSAFFTDLFSIRVAVILLSVPTTVVGGLLLMRGSRFIREDLSLIVTELQEELDEHRRQQEDPDRIPALQVANIDFSYGSVQVLFGVGFEVQRGEVLALLGTNGAGKSTILEAIAGLNNPSRGVVRLRGTSVTYAAPEQRVKLGIRLLSGGKGVFPQMTIRENLEMGAYAYRGDAADQQRRIERALDMFPILRDRQSQAAASMSGGEQQMLALAITLLHDPEVLLIDELSLGLSPVVVQQLLAVVERLKAEGMTIVVVEQSLNVALSIADRAVFLEKGRIRFEGDAKELLERGDLARAVFLGSATGAGDA
jgi:ABC-type branched-subunit amino acid transport system ATPase component/predicted MFS family arabinose efflux permease